MADPVDDEGGGGAGTEAEGHAGFDVVNGLVGGELLQVVLREGRDGLGFDGNGAWSEGFGGAWEEVGGGGVMESGEEG